MAAIQNNIVIINETDERFSSQPNIVASGASASIQAGWPTKFNAAGAVLAMANGEGTTTERFSGIAKSTSTDTATANGEITLWLPLPGLVYACKSTTASATDTAAEIQALYAKRVTFDLGVISSNVYSVDTADTDGATKCVVIIGGDFRTSTVYFVYSPTGTIFE